VPPLTGTNSSLQSPLAQRSMSSEAEIAPGRTMPIPPDASIAAHLQINEFVVDCANCGSPAEIALGQASEPLWAHGRCKAPRFDLTSRTSCGREFSARGLCHDPVTRIILLQGGRSVTSRPAMACVFAVMAPQFWSNPS
jgi:hypothetical protein